MLRMVYGKSGFTPRGLAVWQCGHTRVLHVAVLLAFGGSTTAAPVAAAGCLKSRGLLASQFSARFELQNRNASAFDDALHHFYSAAQAENKLHGWVAFGRYPAGQLLPRQNIIQVLLTHRENYRQLLNHFFDGVPREDVPFIGSLMLSQIPRRIILGAGLNPPEEIPKIVANQTLYDRFKAALPQWFANHTRHLAETDLFVSNSLGLPGVRDGGRVIPLLFYRHGLVLDRLLSRVPPSHLQHVLEIGGGWGGFAALFVPLVSRLLGRQIRCVSPRGSW